MIHAFKSMRKGVHKFVEAEIKFKLSKIQSLESRNLSLQFMRDSSFPLLFGRRRSACDYSEEFENKIYVKRALSSLWGLFSLRVSWISLKLRMWGKSAFWAFREGAFFQTDVIRDWTFLLINSNWFEKISKLAAKMKICCRETREKLQTFPELFPEKLDTGSESLFST